MRGDAEFSQITTSTCSVCLYPALSEIIDVIFVYISVK